MRKYTARVGSTPLARGDKLHDFRGVLWTFLYVTGSAISDGKICVIPDAGLSEVREFFPTVFPGLIIEDIEP